MSEQRIVVETACSVHAGTPGPCRRYVCDHPDDGKPHDLGSGVCKVCPGGSRRIVELPDMEKLREALPTVSLILQEAVIGSDEFDAGGQVLAAARWVLSLESE